MGAYADRKDAPKAFVQRVMAEAELPENARTIWEITANTVEERGYENLYVTSAKSSTNGHAPAATDTPAPLAAATRAAFPNEKDSLIVAEVAIKEARAIAEAMMKSNPVTFGQEYGSGNHVQVTGFTDAGLLDTVRGFTLDFAKIIVDTARALREVPAKEEPAKEDSLFDEEPL